MQDNTARIYSITEFPAPIRDLEYPSITSQGRADLFGSKMEVLNNQRECPKIIIWGEAKRKKQVPDAETVTRLNELAMQRPFCRYYKAKKFDTL